MDSIMVLKDYLGFKYVHGNKFFGQSKGKVFVFKMSVDLQESGVDLVKRMHVGENMENSWIIFEHVKCLKDCTTLTCHVYHSKHCKVLTIMCCDIQSKDGTTQTLFWKNSNYVSNVNFKGFMAHNLQSNWIAVRKIYGEGEPTLLMMGCERI